MLVYKVVNKLDATSNAASPRCKNAVLTISPWLIEAAPNRDQNGYSSDYTGFKVKGKCKAPAGTANSGLLL
jgi:hypothetical protein